MIKTQCEVTPVPSVIRPYPECSHLERFWQYICERQRIWDRRYRVGMNQPWTTDQILNEFSFTNVYRELDRGTVFWYTNIFQPRKDNFVAIIRATLAYRHFNRPDTWEQCFAPYWSDESVEEINWEMIKFSLSRMSADVGTVFTGAFMVTGSGVPPGTPKYSYILDQVRRNCLYAGEIAEKFSDEHAFSFSCHKLLTKLEGIGPFLAYEIYSDLAYTGHTSYEENDWANPGPGAKRGADLLSGSIHAVPRDNYQQIMRHLQQNQQQYFREYRLPFEDVALRHTNGDVKWLTMRNIEHNLCEYSKYNRGSCRGKFKHHGNDLYQNTPALR